MTTQSVLELLQDNLVVPVVVVDDSAVAIDLVAALKAGGISCAEITLRTPAGIASIAAVAEIPDFVVGAGTVLNAAQVDECADAGARFVVSPGFDDEVVERAQGRGLAVIPGIATATELQRAAKAGLKAVKFFPADRLGGLPAIAALAGPFPEMKFMPSGGVTLENFASYLEHPAVFAVGGSWMVPRAALAAGDFGRIRQLSAEAIELLP